MLFCGQEAIRLLIVGCQVCGEIKVLAGTPDFDGVARVKWSCRKCGAGQVLQLQVSTDASGKDLRRIVGGFSLPEEDYSVQELPSQIEEEEWEEEPNEEGQLYR